MAKIEHIKNKRGEVIYPVSKEGAIYDENGVLLSTKIATFITRLVDNLANYYLKSETYTKAEVDDLIGAIQGFTYIVVSELPTASAETMGIVYLVPSEDPQTQNVKDEYITIRSGVEGSYTYSWEQIGSTAIDLSGYVTTEALNTALADYTTTANLTTLLAAKQDTIADLSTIRSGAAAGATAYQKPGTGIPSSDMASGVQTSLGKADSAYQKPSGGIPKTDLESGVQDSLELADTAVQAEPIGSIVPPVDPSEFATKEEVGELRHKVGDLSQLVTSDKSNLVSAINEAGFSGAAKTAIINLLKKVAFVDDEGQKYLDELYAYLFPETVSITAVFTQGQAVIYEDDELATLKQYLVVTALYQDGTSVALPDNAYTLMGTLEEGTSTITVTYGDKSDTFDVIVSPPSRESLFGLFSDGYSMQKVAASGVQRVARTNATARATTHDPCENKGYIFTVTDSTKYNLAVYDVQSLEKQTRNPPTGSIDGYYYIGGTKSIAWKTEDSASTPYCWITLKKMDGTAFTAEELADGAAAVFNYTKNA